MKNMKSIIKSVAVVLSAAVVLVNTGCTKDDEFLKEVSYKYDDTGFYNTQEEIILGLNSVYSVIEYMMMGCQRTFHSLMINGVGLDTFGESSNNDCFSNWEKQTSDNGYARHWSDYLYRMINRANIVIDMMDEREIEYNSEAFKNNIRAEAIFLRGFAYYTLAGMYGAVPIIEHHSTEAKYDYVPSSRQEVWEFVKKDFEWAAQNLPSEPRLEGTIVKAAADSYLAEVCLALGKFDEAVAAATRVISKNDGDYEIMTSRFGSRASEATDRYGNSLAAPQGAYWDLFREGGNQHRKGGNKEVLWAIQYNYGTYSTGGGGDSWFRTHFSYIECGLGLPGYLSNPTTSTITLPNQAAIDAMDAATKEKANAFLKKYGYEPGEAVYKYGLDLACFPAGITGSAKSTVKEANGRYQAQIPRDSIGGRLLASNGNVCGQVVYPSRAMYNGLVKNGKAYGYWDDPNDFRGSEVMIQQDYFLPGGAKWSEAKAMLYERQEAGLYTLAAGDTVSWMPRFWKFSDDKHPNFAADQNRGYDCQWYMRRVAEVYLLRAEAYLAKGDKANAAKDINVVRSRAGAKACTEKDINIDYILDERARELYLEEQRQLTLNRLSVNPNCTYIADCYPTQDETTSNTLYERARKYGFGYENNATTIGREWKADENRYLPNIKPFNYQYPIPTEVIQANTGYAMPQNTGY